MNKGQYRLAAEVEKLIAKYEKDTVILISNFKWELRNIITKYE